MKFLVGTVREPPLRVDFHGKSAENLKTQNPKPKTENRVYAVSLGCPKNLVDTEIMLGGLTGAGWEVTGDACRRRSPPGQYLRLHRAGL